MSECKLKICRLCLAINVRLFDISGTCYQKLLDKHTDRNVNQQPNQPMLACYICYHLLQKYSSFLQRTIQADLVLNLVTNKGNLLTTESNSVDLQTITNFVISPTTVVNISVTKEDSKEVTKEVTKEDIKEIIKEENVKEKSINFTVDDTSDVPQDEDTQDRLSGSIKNLFHDDTDSEDDIPLKNIQYQHKEKIANKRVRKSIKDTKRKKDKRAISDYALEILLTKEEQLKAMAERANSLSYMNSSMKCETCFKGFTDTTAFENHKKRHDESIGPYACSLCGLRYSCARQLNAHTLASHAKRYQCLRCGHKSCTAHQAREHEKWHRGYSYDCKLCGEQFSKPTSYLTHLRKRHPSSQWCSECGGGFVSKRGLIMHRAKAHIAEEPKESDEPASERFCEDCNVQFSSREAWTRHILTSVKHAMDNENSTECVICKSKFPCRSSLGLHLKEHWRTLKSTKISLTLDQAAMKLECGQCGTLFINKSKLQRHINQTHLGIKYDKNIVCEICSKKCTSYATLRYHQRIHTGEKPYECSTCSKRFIDSTQLKIHSRTHTGEKPYRCGVCEKRFTQKPALNRHYRVHTGAKPYKCQYCTKTFSQSNSMKLHTKVVHLKTPPNLRKNKFQNDSEAVGNENGSFKES